MKYTGEESSRDLDQWTETQRGGNLAGNAKEIEMQTQQVGKEHLD